MLTKSKAKKILKDGKVHGKALTDKQRRFFAANAYANGGQISPYTGALASVLQLVPGAQPIGLGLGAFGQIYDALAQKHENETRIVSSSPGWQPRPSYQTGGEMNPPSKRLKFLGREHVNNPSQWAPPSNVSGSFGLRDDERFTPEAIDFSTNTVTATDKTPYMWVSDDIYYNPYDKGFNLRNADGSYSPVARKGASTQQRHALSRSQPNTNPDPKSAYYSSTGDARRFERIIYENPALEHIIGANDRTVSFIDPLTKKRVDLDVQGHLKKYPVQFNTGGDIQLNSSSFQVKGKPNVDDGNMYQHETGPIALDHNEVVVDDFVFSNKLGGKHSYAKRAKEIESAVGKAEKKLAVNPNDTISINTLKQAAAARASLASQQEQEAMAKGYRNMDGSTVQQKKWGGTMRKYANGGSVPERVNGQYPWVWPNRTESMPNGRTAWFYPEQNEQFQKVDQNTYYDVNNEKYVTRRPDGRYRYITPTSNFDTWFEPQFNTSLKAMGMLDAPGSMQRAQSVVTNQQENVAETRPYTGGNTISITGVPQGGNSSTGRPKPTAKMKAKAAAAPAAIYDPLAGKYIDDGFRFYNATGDNTPPPTQFSQVPPPTQFNNTPPPTQTPSMYDDQSYTGDGFTGDGKIKNEYYVDGKRVSKRRHDRISGVNDRNARWVPSTGDMIQTGALASQFLQAAGGWDTATGHYDNTRITPNYYDPANALYQSNRAYQNAANTIDTSSPTLRRAVENQLYAKRLENDQNVNTQYAQMNQQANTQYEQRLADQSRYNAQVNMAVDQMNQQNKDNYTNTIQNAFVSMNEFGKGLNEQDLAYSQLGILRNMYPDVAGGVLGQGTNYASSRSEGLTSTGTPAATTATPAATTISPTAGPQPYYDPVGYMQSIGQNPYATTGETYSDYGAPASERRNRRVPRTFGRTMSDIFAPEGGTYRRPGFKMGGKIKSKKC